MGGGQIDREVEAWVTVLVGGWIDRRTGESGDRWVGRWMNSVLASFDANLTQVRIVWGKGTSTEKNTSTGLAFRQGYGTFLDGLLMREGPAHGG